MEKHIKFIILVKTRVLISSIKRYTPVGDLQLNVRYSVYDSGKGTEIFTFPTAKKRNERLAILDKLAI